NSRISPAEVPRKPRKPPRTRVSRVSKRLRGGILQNGAPRRGGGTIRHVRARGGRQGRRADPPPWSPGPPRSRERRRENRGNPARARFSRFSRYRGGGILGIAAAPSRPAAARLPLAPDRRPLAGRVERAMGVTRQRAGGSRRALGSGRVAGVPP